MPSSRSSPRARPSRFRMSVEDPIRGTSPSLDGEVADAEQERVQPRAEVVESAPEADADSENGSVCEDEDMGDLGGDAEDGDDSNPYKFIDRSLRYQDMIMTKRHAEERVSFFEKFAETMPKGKNPHKKMALYKARVKAVDNRIATFKSKYAAKRVQSAEARAKRLAKAREEKESEDALGKEAKAVINKGMKKVSDMAMKSASTAVKALGDSADEKEKAAVAWKVFSEHFKTLFDDLPEPQAAA